MTTWPAGRPRVLVTDGWLTNAGDAAIAVATDRLIRRHAPDAAVLHAAYGADLVGDRYPDLTFVPPLEALVGTRWSTAALDPDFVAGADLVVSQGGGFLREPYEPWTRLDALERVASTGVPLLLLGQTIGRFDLAFARRSLATTLGAAAAVVVRDQASVHHAIDAGADPDRIILGTDLALALVASGPPPAMARAKDDDAPVAVVLTDHVVEVAEVAAVDRADRAELAVEVLVATLAAHPGRTIEVWSSAQGAGDDHDEAVAARAIATLDAKERERVRHHQDHVDAGELVARTGAAALVVSMRFHPALLGAAQGTPSVLLLDDQKAGVVAGTSLAGGTLGRIARPPAADLGDLPGRLLEVEALLAKQLASPGTRP